MTLKEAIIKCVDNNSGGIKFIDLILELLQMTYRQEIENRETSQGLVQVENLGETIIRIINEEPSLRILEYSWKKENKAKLFVYTP